MIESAMDEAPDDILLFSDIAAICYPGLISAASKNRPTLVRAATAACSRKSWSSRRTEQGKTIYFNCHSAASQSLSLLRADPRYGAMSTGELKALV
jgi:hypothetical protein